jgi:hypothetical protein
MLTDFNERWGPGEDPFRELPMEMMLAQALDPRTKHFTAHDSFFWESTLAAATFVAGKAAVYTAPLSVADRDVEGESQAGGSDDELEGSAVPPVKRMRTTKAAVSDVFEQMAAASGASSDIAAMPAPLDKDAELRQTISLEISSYKALAPIPHSQNPLHWWRDHGARRFPTLACLAKQVLAIPATEAASERVFSTGGQVISDLRWNLGTDNVSTLVFLKNWCLVEGYTYNAAVWPAGKDEPAQSLLKHCFCRIIHIHVAHTYANDVHYKHFHF